MPKLFHYFFAAFMLYNGPGLEIVRDCALFQYHPLPKDKDNKNCQNTTATRIFSEAVL